MEDDEFEGHMKEAFQPDFYEKGSLIFSESALRHGLELLSFLALEVEDELDAWKGKGKALVVDKLRRAQAIAAMLSIALDKYDVKIH